MGVASQSGAGGVKPPLPRRAGLLLEFQVPFLLAGVAVLLLVSGGCVQRRLIVRSTPPGAAVSVDGEEAGATPAEIPIRFYGMDHPQLVASATGGHIENLFRFISLTQVQRLPFRIRCVNHGQKDDIPFIPLELGSISA